MSLSDWELDATQWAFLHFFHADKANAAIHCAPVKFSPITFRLADVLVSSWLAGVRYTPELAIVVGHMGEYELDGGR